MSDTPEITQQAAREMLAALRDAQVALECSAPTQYRYPEPHLRHQDALEAVRAAIALATGGEARS